MISPLVSDMLSFQTHSRAWSLLSGAYPEWTRTLRQYSATEPQSIRRENNPSVVGQFGPIRANPSDPARSRQILQTFVFSGLETYVNESEESLTRFVGDILSHAKSLRESFLEKDSARWFSLTRELKIIGEKGVGKTHLLNYIITRFKPVFDENKVLFVRLSLTRNAYLDNVTLTDWFRAQAAKILVRYYDKASKASQFNPVRPFEFASHLADFIKNTFLPQHAEHYLSKMYHMLNILHDPVKDRDLSVTWMDQRLVEEIYAHAVRSGWGFVVALDQNDLLSHSKTTRALYEQRENQVLEYRSGSTPTPCLLLTCNRPETPSNSREYDERAQEDREHSRSGTQKVVTYRIGKVKGLEVIEKRVNYATQSSVISEEDRIGLKSFQDAIVKVSNRADESKPTIVKIEEICASTRAFLQMITSAASVYFMEGSLNYVFTENAMLHSQRYPAVPYHYRKTGLGLERHTNPDSNKVHDINHLPPIMTFPYSEDATDLGSDANVGIYSLGVRVLQCLEAVNKQAIDINQPELVTLVSAIFGFSSERVELIIDEFIDFDLIIVGRYSRENGKLEGEFLEIAPKSQSILRLYLFDPTYLALSALVVPIPQRLRDEINGEYFFRIASPRDVEKANGVSRWVEAKIWNSIGLAQLIAAAMENTGLKMDEFGQYQQSSVIGPAGLKMDVLLMSVHRSSQAIVKKFMGHTAQVCTRILDSLENRRQIEGSLRRSLNSLKDFFEE